MINTAFNLDKTRPAIHYPVILRFEWFRSFLGRCMPLSVLELDAVRVSGLAWGKKYSHIYAFGIISTTWSSPGRGR